MAGYIKLHRKIKDWEWYRDPNTRSVFIDILLTANIKDQKYRGQVIPRGSVLTTLEDIGRQLSLSINEVRTAIRHLKSTGELHTQKTHNKLLIMVHNYDVYQSSENSNTQPIDTQGTDSAHTGNTHNKVEEERGEGEEKSSSPAQAPQGKGQGKNKKVFPEDCTEMQLALLLAERMRNNKPDCILPKDGYQRWCREIDWMIRLDNRHPKEIQMVIRYSQWDSFEQTVVRSAESLRNNYDRLCLKMKNEVKKHEKSN